MQSPRAAGTLHADNGSALGGVWLCRAPLRLRTGVMLYGPPGCGKTHTVSAAVAAYGLRCISVKGPELLNKYIGASEAAVREVFR